MHIEQAWSEAVIKLRAYIQDKPEEQKELENIRPDELQKGTGSGYVVDCLYSARWALQQLNYQDVIKTAIALGNDTDTTACVAGGIAGLYFGFDAIPQRWKDQLRGQEIVDAVLQRLFDSDAK